MDAILDKIAKILRLAGNEGATEGERLAALAQAQKLAFKHNLDLSEIDLEEKSETRVGDHETDMHLDYHWQHDLLSTLASVNFCRVWWWDESHVRKGRLAPVIAGRPYNVEVVKQMYHFLAGQMEREIMREVSRRGQLPRYALITVVMEALMTRRMDRTNWAICMEESQGDWTKHPFLKDCLEDTRVALIDILKGDAGLTIIQQHTGLTKSYASEIRPYIKRGELAPEIVDDLKTWRYSFEAAMSHRVRTRLHAQFNALKDDAGDNGQALVLRETQALEEFMAQKDFDKSASRSERVVDYAAWRKGEEAGDKINLEQRATLQNNEAKALNR